MTSDEYHNKLYTLKFTAGMNARYHQRSEAWYGCTDRAVRILVAVVAVLAAILAVPPLHADNWSFGVAIAAATLAVILNVTPVVERAKLHGELFRAWTELRKDALLAENKFDGHSDPDAHQVERLTEMMSKVETLNATEPYPDEQLLKKCQGDEYESEWGVGVRTAAQAAEAAKRRQSGQVTSSAAAARPPAPAAGAAGRAAPTPGKVG